MRPFAPLAAAVVLALGLATGSHAQQAGLPDIGSSAGELLTPQEEREYGAYTLYQLRRYGYLLDDPLIDGWLDSMGFRLACRVGPAGAGIHLLHACATGRSTRSRPWAATSA